MEIGICTDYWLEYFVTIPERQRNNMHKANVTSKTQEHQKKHVERLLDWTLIETLRIVDRLVYV